MKKNIQLLLDDLYAKYAQSNFIDNDPIQIPHNFSLKQDIEISGFFSAIFSWGQRKVIIQKARELMSIMDYSPYDFVMNYREMDFRKIESFKHRTFNASDLDFYIRALKIHYSRHDTLESAFYNNTNPKNIAPYIQHFYAYISQIVPCEKRNLKHISTPTKNSSCKRLCMFLRWMVRKDEVDFGLWRNIKAQQLIIPLDVHVLNVASKIGIIPPNSKPNWDTANKITQKLIELDPKDPIKYDLALFSMGVNNFK